MSVFFICHIRATVPGNLLIVSSLQYGYWNLASGQGCQKCNCDPMGSIGSACDVSSGQCECLPGVGGLKCDACLAGYWGFSTSGCTGLFCEKIFLIDRNKIFLSILECAPCEKEGHICDPDTGRCVCPPYTQGPRCEACAQGTWNYHPYKGCKVGNSKKSRIKCQSFFNRS